MPFIYLRKFGGGGDSKETFSPAKYMYPYYHGT